MQSASLFQKTIHQAPSHLRSPYRWRFNCGRNYLTIDRASNERVHHASMVNTKGWQFQWRPRPVPVLSANINNPLTFFNPRVFHIVSIVVLPLIRSVSASCEALSCVLLFGSSYIFCIPVSQVWVTWALMFHICSRTKRREIFCQIHPGRLHCSPPAAESSACCLSHSVDIFKNSHPAKCWTSFRIFKLI